MIKAIIFDFDGVLVQSNNIKEGNFFEIFKEFRGSKEIVEEVKNTPPKKNRFELVEEILKKLGKKGLIDIDDLEKETEKYVAKYSEKTEEDVVNAPEVKGTSEALEILHKRFKLFVFSATPDGYLQKITDRRGVTKYFTAVYGSGDWYKEEALKKIIKENNLRAEDTVFVGDGENDKSAAEYVNMRFIGIINESNDF